MPRRIPRILLTIWAGFFLAACAHAPTDLAKDLPAPEAKTEGPVTAEDGAPIGDEDAQETADGAPTDAATGSPEESGDAEKARKLSISLSEQAFSYSEGDEVVRTGPISSGAEGYPTPTGKFAILSKDEDKVSSRYTNQLGMQAWMPYAMQFHGHYFLHEGWLPGHPDSHGCVRVGEKDARFLFERMKIGDTVTVKP
ncbi:L,D-transpeptidase [Thiorhodococcus minor]|uniref:L,D-transpeptidase n=1 Tax=Thiorhodococcus minor TaxID=57489 RepID=A0A6M0JW21_9GAMM|nr:L,D-transpeptidase [Thiorhodococcus minor]NEV61708.1 L,D-transpeptidase [Thiorhodococcus minor]